MSARPTTVRLLLVVAVTISNGIVAMAEDALPFASPGSRLNDPDLQFAAGSPPHPLTPSPPRIPLPFADFGSRLFEDSTRPDALRSPDTVFRGQSPELVPLVHRRETAIVPVGRISIPTPMKLIGDMTRWGGRFRAAYGTNFDGREMIYGNLLLSSGVPIAIDTEAAYRTDDVLRRADENFWIGDFNLVYRMKQIRWLGFRFGLGANWLTDGDDADVGFNSTIGFDFKLKQPWYVSTVFDWGTLGSEELFHWQITGGVDLGRIELFIGYDFHELGSRERKNYIAGGGFWF